MYPLGLNPIFVVSILVNILVLVSWVVLAIVALQRLRDATLSDLARVVWAIFIVVVPIGGAVALFLVQPDTDSTQRANSLTSSAMRHHGDNSVT